MSLDHGAYWSVRFEVIVKVGRVVEPLLSFFRFRYFMFSCRNVGSFDYDCYENSHKATQLEAGAVMCLVPKVNVAT
jgi:hypothetical protein